MTDYSALSWQPNKAARQLFGFGAFLCGFFVYSSSFFRFWEVFSVKHEMEILVLAGICIVFVPFLINSTHVWLRSSVVVLPLVFTVMALITSRPLLMIADALAGMLLAGIVVTRGAPLVRIAVRVIVTIAGIFASMAVMQFIAILINPELRGLAALSGAFDSESGVFIQHPFVLLGQSTGETHTVLGLQLTRLFSFAAEPSAIGAYFLLPGGLALTLRGKWRLWAVPCLVFCAVSLSGTAAATFAVAAVGFVWLMLTRRHRRWAIAFPFLLAAAMIVIGSDRFEAALRFVEFYAPFPTKFRSGSERFQVMQEHWELARTVFQHPFGFRDYAPIHWSSLPLMTTLFFGLPGLVAQLWVLAKIFAALVDAFRSQSSRLPRLGIAVVFGVLAQATAGTCYGFISASGVFLQALTLFHANALIKQGESDPRAARV